MTGKFLLAVLVSLSLVGQILGQSLSSSISYSNSITFSGTNSNSITLSTSNSNSYSLTTSPSYSVTPTDSQSYTNSASSPPVPPQPQNLTNSFPGCATRKDKTNHQTYLCLAWVDPAPGFTSTWTVTYTATPGGTPQTAVTAFPAIILTGLTPGTTYSISIVGTNSAGKTSLPLTGTQATDPTDAKTDLSKDLTNLTCTNTTSNYRKAIICTWGAPKPTLPTRIDVKARCTATGGKNKILHKSLKGAAINVLLPVNRAQYTCYIAIFGYYPGKVHVAVDGRGTRFAVTCSSSSGCKNTYP